MMQVPDKKLIVGAIAEIARRRDMTHIVLSPEAARVYSSRVTKEDRRKGIGHTKVHNASIIVVPEVPDNLVFSFSTQSRSQKVAKLLAAVRAEDYEEARALMTEMAQRRTKYMAVTHLPTKAKP